MEETHRDYISSLPDCVIHHIFSYMDTLFAVRMSVLSTRWRYLSRSLPFLNFYSDTLYAIVKKPMEDYRVGFENLVDQVLRLHDSSDIQRFLLEYEGFPSRRPESLNSWISDLVGKNVQEFEIDLLNDTSENYTRINLKRLQCLFNCNSLRQLKLVISDTRLYMLRLPEYINLPNLRTMYLDGICFKDETLTQKLFSRCPVLESLNLHNCSVENSTNLKICAPNLKHWDFWSMPDQRPVWSEYCKINIHAPSLTSFDCWDINVIEDCNDLKSCPVLEKACIEINTGRCKNWVYKIPENDAEEFKKESAQQIIRCLRALCNVIALTLSQNIIKYLPAVMESMENQYPNLRKLELRGRLKRYHLHGIMRFLMISPNIETLVIDSQRMSLKYAKNHNVDEVMSFSECVRKYWEKDLLPCDMLHHVRLVEMQNVQGIVDELIFLGSLLKTAPVLDKMVLHFENRGFSYESNRTNFKEKVLSFPQASPNLEISFLYLEKKF